ncbi:MAG: intradiol ring-cleavage dioxygenase [Alphaproteobacteria bacterium]|nr:intradiol ring-cleavage dioxygenase [Alphaproteobacteria bacterium]
MDATRRRVVWTAGGLTVLGALARPSLAAGAIVTPRQTEGPFYPVSLPLDSDNDLATVAGQATQARGQVLHLFGRVRDAGGKAVGDARVEIWQCDADGRYHHPGERRGNADPSFQGYGQNETEGDGLWRFRTIRPVTYPGRAPHIHFAISGPGFQRLTTQMYVAGEAGNERDFVLNTVGDPKARASLIVAFEPAPEIEAGALKGNFEIVLGHNAVIPA